MSIGDAARCNRQRIACRRTCHRSAFPHRICAARPSVRQTAEISNFMLDNGMEVVVIPDHRAPIVTHMVWYKAGSADEPPGKSGIAHFFEHLMFKGTKNHQSGEFGAKVAEIGGSENAFTSWDYTAYYQTVSPDALATMMSYEVRPDAQPDPHRRGHRPGARRHPRGAALAHRRQPRSAAVGGNRRDAVPEPALPHPGHRLDAGDAAAEPRSTRSPSTTKYYAPEQRGAGRGGRRRRGHREARLPRRPMARCRAARTCRRVSARPSRNRTPSAP